MNDEGEWIPDLYNLKIKLHGKNLSFKLAPTDYANANIDVKEKISGDPALDKLIIIARILPHLISREELFLSIPQLLEMVKRPMTLPLFIQLDDWVHPDGKEFSLPSNSPSLRSLAKAIAYNQTSLYEYPKDLGNTNWINWPNFFKNYDK